MCSKTPRRLNVGLRLVTVINRTKLSPRHLIVVIFSISFLEIDLALVHRIYASASRRQLDTVWFCVRFMFFPLCNISRWLSRERYYRALSKSSLKYVRSPSSSNYFSQYCVRVEGLCASWLSLATSMRRRGRSPHRSASVRRGSTLPLCMIRIEVQRASRVQTAASDGMVLARQTLHPALAPRGDI